MTQSCVCLLCVFIVFITTVPIIKLFAWGEGDSGGHVLRETTSLGTKTAVVARRQRRRPGGHTTAVGSGGRRAPFSTEGKYPGGGYMALELFFVSARTNKRHHHLTTSHTHTDRSIVLPLLPLSSVRPFSNGIFRSNDAPASLPPASSSLAHARRTDGFCNQNTDQLCSLAGRSLLTVYVGVV
jgi:hypothetical protein